MKTVYFSLITIFSLLFLDGKAQNEANTLLWKINGNGLKENSYLYGTMHVRDKRVFNLSDSVYFAMTHTKSFAMEILFDSIMNSVVNAEEKVSRGKPVNIDSLLTPDEIRKLDEKLIKNLGVGHRALDLRRIEYIQRLLGYAEEHPDDLPTFLDAYLMQMNKRMGKNIYGLERLEEYSDILDDRTLTRNDLLQLINTNFGKSKGLVDHMITVYSQDKLVEVAALSATMDSALHKALLLDRNKTMARRMDSLMHIQTLFTAVGAAHLPGPGGLIELLREKGFTVEPVMATSRTPANTYTYSGLELDYYTQVSEAFNYKVDLPGKPVNMQDNIILSAYMDFGTGIAYMVGEATTYLGSAEDRIKKIVDRFIQGSGYKVSDKHRKYFKKDDYEGCEILGNYDKNNQIRLRIILRGSKAVFLIVYSQYNSNLYSLETDHCFESLQFTNLTPASWIKNEFKEQGVSVTMPGKPNVRKVPGNRMQNFSMFTAEAPDNTNGIDYGLTLMTMNPGFLFYDDTLPYFNFREKLLERNGAELISESVDTIDGLKSNQMILRTEDGYYIANLMQWANKVLILVVSSKDSLSATGEVNSFFQSFQHTEGEQTNYSLKTGKDGQFESWVAQDFYYVDDNFRPIKSLSDYQSEELAENFEDVMAFSNKWSQMSYDSLSGVTYVVFCKKVNDFYWAKDDSVLFKAFSDLYIEESNDSVASFVVHRSERTPSADVLIKTSGFSGVKRFKLFLSGNEVYMIHAPIVHNRYATPNYSKFFSDFHIKNPVAPTTRISKADTLMKMVLSPDSAVYSKVNGYITYSGLSSEDLPVIVETMLHQKINRNGKESDPADDLHYKFDGVVDTSLVGIVKEKWPQIKREQRPVKLILLSGLAKVKTKESYQLISELVKDSLDGKASYNMVYALTDSLELTRLLFPELLNKVSDPAFCITAVKAANTLLDSGRIEVSMLEPYKHKLYEATRALSGPNAEQYNLSNWGPAIINLLRFNDPENIGLLKGLLSHKSDYMRQSAAVMLIKFEPSNKKALKLINQMAEDKSQRLGLYRDMKKLGILNMFPVNYKNRISLAESELAEMYLDEDYGTYETSLVQTKEETVDGVKKTTLLYRIKFDGGGVEYLAIVGPYLNDELEVMSPAVSGVYYDQFFDEGKIEEQYKALVKQNTIVTEKEVVQTTVEPATGKF